MKFLIYIYIYIYNAMSRTGTERREAAGYGSRKGRNATPIICKAEQALLLAKVLAMLLL
jgi:hypothetical protein